jgi:hypothetical protein
VNFLKTIRKRYKILVIFLAFIAISTVAAYIYETGQITVTQTIINVAALTVSNSALGNIEEGQTITYTKSTTPTLGTIVNITTTKDNVYLNFASSDLSAQTTYYSTYSITVKFAAVGTDSTHAIGDVACIMTIGTPNPASVTLDEAGTYSFDFEITTTAKTSITADTPTTVTVTVTAQSAA